MHQVEFCYHCVECIKFATCAKFHDDPSNKNKVMMGGGGFIKAHVKVNLVSCAVSFESAESNVSKVVSMFFFRLLQC